MKAIFAAVGIKFLGLDSTYQKQGRLGIYYVETRSYCMFGPWVPTFR